MHRRLPVFVAALVALALVIAFAFLGTGATENTAPAPESGVPSTTR